MYSGDEFYDDDVTSGVFDDPHQDAEAPEGCELCSDSDATEFFEKPPFPPSKRKRFCLACYEQEERRVAYEREARDRDAATDAALNAWKDERGRS